MSWTFAIGQEVEEALHTDTLKIDVIACEVLNRVPEDQRHTVVNAMENAHEKLLRDDPHGAIEFIRSKDAKGNMMSCMLEFEKTEKGAIGDNAIVKGRYTTTDKKFTIHSDRIYVGGLPETILENIIGKDVREIIETDVLTDRRIEIIECPQGWSGDDRVLVMDEKAPKQWDEAMEGWVKKWVTT